MSPAGRFLLNAIRPRGTSNSLAPINRLTGTEQGSDGQGYGMGDY